MVYSNNEQVLNYKHKIVTTLRRSEHHEQEQMKGNTSEVIEWLYQKQSNIRKIINSSMVNLFRMDLFAPPPPPSPLSPVFKFCCTNPTIMKLGKVIPYPKKIQKVYEPPDRTLEFC